jgi:hypothetical protein
VRSHDLLRVLFSPEGHDVVVLDTDGNGDIWVRRWQAVDGNAIGVTWRISRPSAFGNTALFSPDGKTLYHISRHGVRTFDLNSGHERSPDEVRDGRNWPIGESIDGFLQWSCHLRLGKGRRALCWNVLLTKNSFG